MNYKVVVSYDGTNFHGWAKQANVVTVQQEIEKCLSQFFNTSILIQGSGRTDAHVHAIGQVFNFHAKTQIKPKVLLKALNETICPGIHFQSISVVDGLFHARFGAISKTYHYIIELNHFDLFRQ
ncbi:MAG: hypothetical protein LBV37_02140 [Mycoplasmataceae bacterium]|jgi:tRNA pseudouridine38-40 synthase|nr:hypothetical protein [Mycoplasmataceae bacterium]